MVNISSILLGGGPFFFIDFNGNRLDLANSVATDFNPIISFPADTTPGVNINQQWQLAEVGGRELHIQNLLGPFISYPLASSGGDIQFAAAVSSVENPVTFFVSQVLMGSNDTFTFTDANSGMLLTALSPSVPGLLGSPATFTSLVSGTLAPAQIWTLEQSD